jgi:hypothetical protein
MLIKVFEQAQMPEELKEIGYSIVVEIADFFYP